MNQTTETIAKTFYKLMAEKNIEALEQYVHPDIVLITPLTKQQGKAAYLEAVKTFLTFANALTIRAQFADDHQAVVVYDVEFPVGTVSTVSTVSLMTFQEGLIAKVELFFDASPLRKVTQ